MLESKKVPYRYRDYKQDPLSATEIRKALRLLGLKAKDLLRKKDAAFKELGLAGDEPDSRLVPLMAKHPTLLQRPIGIHRGKAALGRPIENLLELPR